LTPFHRDPSSGIGITRLVRIARVFRVFRAIKALKCLNKIRDLKVVFRALMTSITSLAWSMLLVAVIIVAAAIFMVKLTQAFVHDEAEDVEQRQWVYDHFGSPSRATWTMFEATFTTAWPNKARQLIMGVSPWFALFWVPYVVVVNFAVMKVIASLFIKTTFAEANLDAEKQAVAQMKQREQFAAKIRTVFNCADQSGDGFLSRWEFDQMLQDPKVMVLLKQLEIEPHEVTMLYNMLSDDDGTVDYDEFLSGALNMKNTARTLHIIEVLHQNLQLKKAIEKLEMDLQKWVGAICKGLTWPPGPASARGPDDGPVLGHAFAPPSGQA